MEALVALCNHIAVLFGSITRRRKVRDVDIAVYASSFTLKELLKLEARLEREIGAPVDLVQLDLAPPKLVYEALTKGVKIVSRDSELYNSFITLSLA